MYTNNDFSSLKVLFIDDERQALQGYMHLVSKLCSVYFAENYQQAFVQINQNKPDLIVLDVSFPDSDGFDICRTIRAQADIATTPIIFFSANTQVNYKLEAFKAGGIDYMDKSITHDEFSYRIINHLSLLIRTRQLEQLSHIDPVTNIANRRLLDFSLNKAWRRCIRLREQCSAILIDIDDFKAYNTHYGHLKGDKCLYQVAQVLSEFGSRPDDLVARFGGEEFAVLLPECSPYGAELIANSIRENIIAERIEHHASSVKPYLTVSVGVATIYPEPKVSADVLFRIADDELYKAKANGKNTVNAIACTEEQSQQIIQGMNARGA